MPEIAEQPRTGTPCLNHDAQAIPPPPATDQNNIDQRIPSGIASRSTTSPIPILNGSHEPTSFTPLSTEMLLQHDQCQESYPDQQRRREITETLAVGAVFPSQLHGTFDLINTFILPNTFAHPFANPFYRFREPSLSSATVTRERYQTSSVQMEREIDQIYPVCGNEIEDISLSVHVGYDISTSRDYLDGVGSQFDHQPDGTGQRPTFANGRRKTSNK